MFYGALFLGILHQISEHNNMNCEQLGDKKNITILPFDNGTLKKMSQHISLNLQIRRNFLSPNLNTKHWLHQIHVLIGYLEKPQALC